jgi:hypothetical protein
MKDIRSVDERLTTGAPVDLTRAHDRIGRGMQQLAEKLRAAFPMTPHPMGAPFARYSTPDERMRGELRAFTGDRLDWVIDSWIGSPAQGFTNHHLTIWLDDSVAVPHLAFAMGTIPDLFVFCDLVPRSDLWTDLATLDRYHATFNDLRLQVSADARFTPFVSKEVYIRQAISPIGLCEAGAATDENIDLAFSYFDQLMTRWIPWVKEAPPVPEAERAALRARDRFVRRTIVERDPANVVAEKVLGPELTHALVRVLGRIES